MAPQTINAAKELLGDVLGEPVAVGVASIAVGIGAETINFCAKKKDCVKGQKKGSKAHINTGKMRRMTV